MNEIRFLHTDCWRLTEPVAALTSTPEWLRRMARDATRSAVLRTLELATAHQAGFLFVAAPPINSNTFSESVADWLNTAFQRLREGGTKIVMAASHPSIDQLADVLLQPQERLLVKRQASHLELAAAPIETTCLADLAVTNDQADRLSSAPCNYVYHPQVRHEVSGLSETEFVYSAGATQSLGPTESGSFGCLLVRATPEDGSIAAEFHATDTLRFETCSLDAATVTTEEQLCEAVVDATRELTRQQNHTTVIDWQVSGLAPHRRLPDLWQEQRLLKSIRNGLQTGHLGAWPRRIAITPASITAGESQSGTDATLRTVLCEDRQMTPQAVWDQLVEGTRLLRRAA